MTSIWRRTDVDVPTRVVPHLIQHKNGSFARPLDNVAPDYMHLSSLSFWKSLEILTPPPPPSWFIHEASRVEIWPWQEVFVIALFDAHF